MGGGGFVGRDEFEAVKAMAAAARDENEILKARIAALEGKLTGPAAGTTKRSPKPKPRAKLVAKKKSGKGRTAAPRSRCSKNIPSPGAGRATAPPRARSLLRR